jgi:hypothetical protein
MGFVRLRKQTIEGSCEHGRLINPEFYKRQSGTDCVTDLASRWTLLHGGSSVCRLYIEIPMHILTFSCKPCLRWKRKDSGMVLALKKYTI